MTGCYAWPTAVRTPTVRSFLSPCALAPTLTVICPLLRRHNALGLRTHDPRQARRLWPSHPGLRRRGPQGRTSGHRRERPPCGPRDHSQLWRARAAEETCPAASFVCFGQKKYENPIAYSSAVKEPSVSASESEDDGEGEKSRKRHKRRHLSPSPGGEGEEDGKRHRRKHKRKHRQDKGLSQLKPAPPPEESEPSGERKETEEEYDARLEREENERLAAARQHELERLKRQHEQETTPSTNGVRFKGISFVLLFLASLMTRT
jgi:hypothetical protein